MFDDWQKEADYLERVYPTIKENFKKLYFKYFAFHIRRLRTTNIVLLIQNGKFYNATCFTDPDGVDHGSGYTIAKLLDLQISNSNPGPYTLDTLPMPGFQTFQLFERIDILLEHDYIVVFHDENKHKNRVMNIINREQYETFTPELSFSKNRSSNRYLMTIYQNKNFDKQNHRFYFDCYISLIDFSTGDIYLMYIDGAMSKNSIDEIRKIIHNYKPKSFLVIDNKKSKDKPHIHELNKTNIKNTLGVHYSNNIHFIQNDMNIMNNQEYIQKTFTKVFDPHTIKQNQGVIEFIGLENYPAFTSCLLHSFNHVYHINKAFLGKMKTPVFLSTSKSFVKLSDDTVFHLDVLNHHKQKESLFSILNNVKTAMGFRQLKHRLLHPLTDTSLINQRYLDIDFVDGKENSINDKLAHIVDVERVFNMLKISSRKNALDYFFQLIYSWNTMKELFATLNLNQHVISMQEILDYIDSILPKDKRDEYRQLKKWQRIVLFPTYNNTSYKKEIDALSRLSNEINIYKSCIDKAIDKDTDLVYNQKKIYFQTKYSKTVYDTATKQYITKDPKSKKRIALRSLMKKTKSTINFSEGELATLTNDIFECCDIIDKYQSDIVQHYIIQMEEKFNTQLQKINEKIQDLDIATNHSLFRKQNGYVKPVLTNKKESCISAKDVRHPIIEQISNEEFIPNDVVVDKNNTGYIIYGLNASGKSVYLKSIGLSIILAQSGFYVPASKFIYAPFHHILSRVPQGDDIHRGKSTFQIEMDEMKYCCSIADDKSLILSDELCSSTEHISAVSLVGALCNTLIEKRCRFFMASHIHELKNLEFIRNEPSVQIKSFQANIKKDGIVYNRKLVDDEIHECYGLEIANVYGLQDEFMKKAWEIRNRIQEKPNTIVSNKRSNYNKQKIVDQCAMCGKENGILHTHHKQQQKYANEHDLIDNRFHKNKIHNLEILCKSCHIKHHQEEKTKKQKTIQTFFTMS